MSCTKDYSGGCGSLVSAACVLVEDGDGCRTLLDTLIDLEARVEVLEAALADCQAQNGNC